MLTLEQLATRIAVLETEVAKVRQEMATARALAKAADRAASEFAQVAQAHTRSLTALRESQVALGSDLREFQWETRHRLTEIGSQEKR